MILQSAAVCQPDDPRTARAALPHGTQNGSEAVRIGATRAPRSCPPAPQGYGRWHSGRNRSRNHDVRRTEIAGKPHCRWPRWQSQAPWQWPEVATRTRRGRRRDGGLGALQQPATRTGSGRDARRATTTTAGAIRNGPGIASIVATGGAGGWRSDPRDDAAAERHVHGCCSRRDDGHGRTARRRNDRRSHAADPRDDLRRQRGWSHRCG